MGNINGLRNVRSRSAHHGSCRRSLAFILLAVLALVSNARAQQQFNLPVINSLKDVPVTDILKDAPARKAATSNALAASPQASQPEEEDFIKPSRPGVANPAEIQKAGVLQVEYGYDANFRSQELHTEQTGPLALRFAATSRLLVELDLDTFKSG
ncbi:MAG: hypothetical protein LC747_07505 [Acidobacteria bacterium]|nr:hypothetical protein [Acidobacteriota bacterium]